jgi:hypothetical protein
MVQIERTHEVDRDQCLPFSRRAVLEQAEPVPSRIVDQDVDLAIQRLNPCDGVGHR